MRSRWLNIMVLLSLLLGMLPLSVQAAPAAEPAAAPVAQATPDIEVEAALRAQLAADETTGYVIYFHEKPDLSPAYDMDWVARGRFVANALSLTAERSQANVRAYLDKQGIKYEAFWIVNAISVKSSNRATFDALMTYPEIKAVRQHRQLSLIEPQRVESPAAPQAIEPNISHVLADQVWALGYRGEGMVVANVDTGVRYTHDALVDQYRGNLGGAFDHNYSWWDPYGDHPAEPGDDNGHGSHTMGTMVGDDGGANQIGMAPGAKWIACRGCSTSSCGDVELLECAQFFAAPWDLNKANPNPDMRPNAVNNSWGDCATSYDGWYQDVVDAWLAAGIYPVFSNGNASNCGYPEPPGLNTVGNPARYGNVTGVGSSGRDNGQYATHSNWGPTDNPDTVNPKPGWANLKPQVLAPGENIRSSTPGSDSDYQGGWSGTSMSAPHVTGLIALMWQAAPCLIGDYARTETIIEDTATPMPYDDGTGSGASVPNQATGWGEINALAAVQTAAGECGDSVIAGQVTAAGNPVAGALVKALSAGGERKTTTNAEGLYALNVFSGTYTLQASRYGYQTAVVPNVAATTDMTTTQNIALTPAQMYEVSGQVTDATTGWPLYAHISISGDPVGPIAPDNSVWTNPATGEYSIVLAEGITYTFSVEAWVAGYNTAMGPVGPLTGDVSGANFALQPDMAACTAPGYYFSGGMMAGFEDADFPPPGWTVINYGGDCAWEQGAAGDNLTGGTGKFALADSDACGMGTTMNTALVSTPFDVSGLSQVNLSFAYDYNNLSALEVAAVDVSANNGATWVNLVNWNTDQRGPATFSQDVTAILAGSTQARVRFRYYAPSWDWWFQVDDVVLGNPVCQVPPAGGLVIGNVYDANYPTMALPGAAIVNAAGGETTAVATPNDPAVSDAFYTLFAPEGAQVFTATMKGGYAPDVATVTVVDGDAVEQNFQLPAGLLAATPLGLETTVELGFADDATLTLGNTGGAGATFELKEKAGRFTPVHIQAFTGNLPANNTPVSLGAAPQEPVGDPAPAAAPLAAAAPAYAIDLMTGNLVQFMSDTPGTWTVIGNTGLGGPFAGDFLNGDFSQMYVLDYDTNAFYSVDTATAAATLIGPSAPQSGESWTGLTGSADGTLYASSTDISQSTLYMIDPATGAVTVIGDITNAPAIIDIAINADGDMYGVDLVENTLVKIDPATGAGTVIGALGFDPNYAQGMDFEEESGVLYWAAYGTGGELRIIDTTTGASTSVGGFPGGAEVDCLSFATGGAADVPWLFENPVMGNVSAAGNTPVVVTFDSAYVDQPGEYLAELVVKNNTPYGKFNIPVTMTVTPPQSWGKLTGTVIGQGVCDEDPAPLAEAEVRVESATTGRVWMVTTDVSGTYTLWVDQAHSPLTVTVTAPDYLGETGGVVVAQGQTTVVDFNLRLLLPCLSYNPANFDVTLEMGTNTHESLTLSNTGAGAAEYEMVEITGGFMPMSGVRGYVEYLPATAPANGPINAIHNGALSTAPSRVPYTYHGWAPQAVNIIAYADDDQHTPTPVEAALQSLGLTYTFYGYDDSGNNLSAFIAEVNNGGWDLVIYAADSWALVDASDYQAVADHITNGGMAIAQSWAIGYDATHQNHPLWAAMGASYAGWLDTLTDLYWWNPGHPIFSGVPEFTDLTDVGYIAYGARMNLLGAPETGLGGFTAAPAAGQAGVILRGDNRTIYKGLTDNLNSGDEDGDGTLDATEWWTNAVNYILNPGEFGGGIPWLTETPVTGTVAADANTVVDLTFDAGVPETMQPGTYYGALKVGSNAANDVANVPVTLTVTAPDTWGKIAGVVTGLGYCDVATPTLLEDAEVIVESGTGLTAWTLETDENGAYQLWLDVAHSPVTITVSYPDHVTQVFADVVVTADATTTRNAPLRWAQPCLTVDPDLFDVTVTLGTSTTVPLTLDNAGAVTTSFAMAEYNGGFVSLAPVSAQPLAPAAAGTPHPEWAETGTPSGAPVIGAPSGGPASVNVGTAWETMAPLPSGRAFNAVIADTNGYVYVIGGTSDAGGLTPTNTNFRYDTASNTWSTMASMPSTLDSIDGAVINGKIYIPGDANTATTFVYDIAADSWATIAANGGYTARSQYQVVAIGTNLYVLGGIAGSASTTEVWVLNTASGTWSAGVPMQKSRTSFSAGAINGAIYVAGGVLFPGFAPDMTAEKFDGTSWSYIADVPNGGGAYTRWSYNADAVGTDGLWLAAGRRDAGWNILNHAGYYNPTSDTWTDSPTIPTLAQGRVYMEGDVATDGYLYVIGGRNSAADTAYTTNERLEVGYAGETTGGDMPWLFEDPITGTVAADSAFPVDLIFDASATVTEITQPGEYFGTLYVNSDDPYHGKIAVPVTMTVEPPATWGKVMGTVTGLGHCNANPAPLADLDVLIENSSGMSWTVTTDVSGTYQLWLAAGPVTITVEAPGYEKGEAFVTVLAGQTTTRNFDLRLLAPCVTANPAALHATLEINTTATQQFTLNNVGAADTDWNLVEEHLGDLTVTPPGVTSIWTEGFEGAFPPAGWVLTQTGAIDDPGWEQTTARVYNGTYAAYHDDANTTGSAIAWMILPQLTVPAGGKLSFWQNNNYSSFGEYHGLWVSTASDDPADFVELFDLGMAPEDAWGPMAVDLSAYVGQSVYLAFRYEGDYADEWYIDDVSLQAVDSVIWLTETPDSGNLAANTGAQVVDVDFDANAVDQPGDYVANLSINSDDTDSPIVLPVTMTVTAPASWGQVSGVVSGQGHCGLESNPLENAEVVIWDAGGAAVVTLTTDISGAYSYWLPNGVYTLTVTAADHTDTSAVVTVPASDSATQNFSLIWLGPCTAVAPVSIADTLAMGTSSMHVVTLTNTGAGALNYNFLEFAEGYLTLPFMMTLSAPVAPLRLAPVGDMSFLTAPDATGARSTPQPRAPLPKGVHTITHSASQSVWSGNSVACGAGGIHADNSYLRVFNLLDFGIRKDFEVSSIDIGIETAAAGSGGAQPATVNIYTLSGPLAWANMTLIGSADTSVTDQDLTVLTIPVTATAPAGSAMVVEFFTPDGSGAGHSLYVGSNDLGQTAPTYLAAAACGISEPTDVAAIGFPEMQLVMNVTGFYNEPVDLPWLSENPTSGAVAATTVQTVAVTLDADQVPLPGVYYATLEVASNDPGTPYFPIAVALTATLPTSYGQITGTVMGLGPCDDSATAMPLAGAVVTIESATQSWTLRTDADGGYDIWIDAAHSPVTLTVNATGYAAQSVGGVTVAAGATAAQDFDLRRNAPCPAVAPTSIHEVVELGMSTTVPLTISNTGLTDLTWNLSDAAPWLTEDPTYGDTQVGDTSAVTVTLDAGVPEITGPGDYVTTLYLYNDSPLSPVAIPVTLTVAPPTSWGQLTGLVNGLGYCNAVTMPMEGAVVYIESQTPHIELVESPLLEESFEDTFPPSGWTLAETGAWDDPGWQRTMARANTGSYAVYHDDNDTDGSAISWLILPQVTLPAEGGMLHFWQNQVYPTYYEYHGLWVSTASADPADFVELQQFPAGTSYTWGEVVVDLQAYAGQSIYLAFRYEGDYADEWYLDDVAVMELVPEAVPANWTLTTDVSGTYNIWLDEMFSPFTVTVSNEAGYEARVFTSVEVTGGDVTTLNADLRWMQPCVTVTPETLSRSVPLGGSATTRITLRNAGAFHSAYLINEFSGGFDPLGPLAAGGPDTFGYHYADSNDFFGPAYGFVDITDVGTPLTLGDNDFEEVAIGFAFKFYGASATNPNRHNTLFINSNGFLSFGAGSTDLSPDTDFPNPTLPNNLIAAAWDDLVPGTLHYQSFAQCPYNPNPLTLDACFIVQYSNFTHQDGSPAGTWEVILFNTGSILMQYADVDAPNAGVGIEGPLGLAGLGYGPTLADERAICFAYPGEWTNCQSAQVPWLTVTPTEGDLAANANRTLNVAFDASVPEVAAPGDYMAMLVIFTDDPIMPYRTIPVTMTVGHPETLVKLEGVVTGWSKCDAASAPLEGAQVAIAASSGNDFVLTTDENGAYAVWVDLDADYTMTVSYPGYVSVTFVGAVETMLQPRNVDLRLDAPCISVAPETFDVTLPKERTVTRTLTIENSGAGDFAYNNIFGSSLWLSVAPKTGVVPAGASQEVTLIFNTTGLVAGDVYSTILEVAHLNTAVSRLFVRPVRMTVLDEPVVVVDVVKTADPADLVLPGGLITYTVVFTNHYDLPLSLTATDMIPADTTYVPLSATGGATFIDPPGHSVVWNGSLDAGATTSFSFQVRVGADVVTDTIILNTVTVEAAGLTFTASTTVTVGQEAPPVYRVYLPLVARNF